MSLAQEAPAAPTSSSPPPAAMRVRSGPCAVEPPPVGTPPVGETISLTSDEVPSAQSMLTLYVPALVVAGMSTSTENEPGDLPASIGMRAGNPSVVPASPRPRAPAQSPRTR